MQAEATKPIDHGWAVTKPLVNPYWAEGTTKPHVVGASSWLRV
jgi:hypothetical protein